MKLYIVSGKTLFNIEEAVHKYRAVYGDKHIGNITEQNCIHIFKLIRKQICRHSNNCNLLKSFSEQGQFQRDGFTLGIPSKTDIDHISRFEVFHSD